MNKFKILDKDEWHVVARKIGTKYIGIYLCVVDSEWMSVCMYVCMYVFGWILYSSYGP